ncbi:hypothetical protein BaRGS_00038751 [Batillaria attramentaria]|uniref:Uncharacterized protein n=1 Tax=Batillaria attramentaria TaxID=370345 RepID=A0ABD0J574_9CAEN
MQLADDVIAPRDLGLNFSFIFFSLFANTETDLETSHDPALSLSEFSSQHAMFQRASDPGSLSLKYTCIPLPQNPDKCNEIKTSCVEFILKLKDSLLPPCLAFDSSQ